MPVSIVMATYNGDKYIRRQLESIVNQLRPDDELIISDDGSTDDTLDIINSYLSQNVRLINGPHKGVIKNFEKAFSRAANNIILICDQDDVWVENKIKVVNQYFSLHPDVKVLMHDAYVMKLNPGDTQDTIFLNRHACHGVLKNIIESTYYGCCMAVDKQYLLGLLPFPNIVDSYDQYIGNCAELDKKSAFIPDKLIYHREGTDNWSKKQGIFSRIRIRMRLILGDFYYLAKKDKR